MNSPFPMALVQCNGGGFQVGHVHERPVERTYERTCKMGHVNSTEPTVGLRLKICWHTFLAAGRSMKCCSHPLVT